MNAEQKADKLEGLLQDNNVSEVSRLLQWEATNKPEEYSALLQKFKEKNDADPMKGLLPTVELHDDGGFLGTGINKHFDGFVIKDHGRQVAHGQEHKGPQVWHPGRGSNEVIYGVQPQEQVNTNSMLRAASNAWNAPKGFVSHINQGGHDNSTHTYNNQALSRNGFRSHLNGQ